MKDPIGKMAELIYRLHLDPDTAVAAVYAHALRNRKPEGPYLNMLGSEKFVVSAMAEFLNVPRDKVREQGTTAAAIGRIEEDFKKSLPLMIGFTGHMTGLYSVPATYRLFYSRGNDSVVAELADDAIEELRASPALTVWLEDKGWDIDRLVDEREAARRRLQKIRTEYTSMK